MKKQRIAAAILMIGMTIQAGTVFVDTFDTVDTTDINSNSTARQSGGLVTGTYTGIPAYYGINGNKLVQTGAGEIVLNANLASYIAGGNFTLSFRQTLLVTNGSWSSVYLASATEDTRGNSRVGFHTWGTGNGTAFTLYSGTGTNGAAYAPINITGAQMDALWQSNFGMNFDRLAEHTIQFVSTAGTGGTNTCDFVVDGVVVYNDAVYAFNDDTVRNIEMISTLPNAAGDAYQALYDDLAVNGAASGMRQETVKFDVRAVPEPERSNPDLAGWSSANPAGVTLSADRTSLLRDGKPMPLAMGEFHPQRYPAQDWEEAVLEMKAGGLNAIGSYWFWVFTEPRPGEFDFSGSNDLRRFLELCRKHDMLVFLRVGPFCNAEILCGGLPPWLFGMPYRERSNDSGYLERVGLYYRELAQQAKGLLWKDGGPVFMLQVENELGHAPNQWDGVYRFGAAEEHRGPHDPKDFVRHYENLRRMAVEAGFDVPFYTMTAWGTDVLPEHGFIYAYGGYMYLGKPGKNNSTLTALRPLPQFQSPYPLQFIELGAAGSPARIGWVPQPPVESAISTALSQLGASDALTCGWYMYHGGTNPLHPDWGWGTKAPGLGLMSYDYNAPLSEYGLPRPAYYDLRPFHQTLRNFGNTFTYGGVVAQNPVVASDEDRLRASVRLNADGGGALFVLHYGNVNALSERNAHFELQTKAGDIRIPESGELNLINGDAIILPFNLILENGVRLISSTAQLSGHVPNGKETACFVSTLRDQPAQMVFELPKGMRVETSGKVAMDGSRTVVTLAPALDATLVLEAADGKRLVFTVLPAKEIRHSVEAVIDGRKIYLVSDQDLVVDADRIRLTSLETNQFRFLSYPGLAWQGGRTAGTVGIFSRFEATVPERKIRADLIRIDDQKMLLKIPPEQFEGLNDIYATVSFEGMICRIFDVESGLPVGDQLWSNDLVWRVGLKRFKKQLAGKGLLFRATGEDGKVRQSVKEGMLLETERTEAGLGSIQNLNLSPEYPATFTKSSGTRNP